MKINILGSGLMGKQIASFFYLSGCDVHLYNHKELKESDFMRQIKLIKRTFPNTTEGKITYCSDIEKLPNNITIESVLEDITIKKEIYSAIRNKNTQAYFSNTSSFTPAEIFEDVNGLHFFNPISLRLVEITLNQSTEKKDIAELLGIFDRHEFEVVFTHSNRGYIGNYILFHEISSALKLIEKYDYAPTDIDRVYKKLYDGRNILKIIDVIGIDIVSRILTNLHEHDQSIYLPLCLNKALELNILGRKNKTTIREIL